jgi:luciferase family oxidoreductase group 1
MLPLSILDLSFVTTATPGAVAIRNTIDLARLADDLGYRRFWVAEHHNLPSVASAAPEVMIAAIAAATRRIRVGSGGVMLPNHAALMVAERFKVLEALHPGRIDLGLGRAPGTDPRTMMALRRRQEARESDDFLEPLSELLAWKRGGFPEGHPLAGIRAMPEDVELPPLWLLGSSDYSARLAARLGLGFAFAHHFAHHDAEQAITLYRAGFRPSVWLAEPHAILATAAICAETEAEAERLAATADLAHVRRMRGIYGPLPSPEEGLAYAWSPPEEHARRENRRRLFVGDPTRLREELSAFATRLRADELMLTAAIFDHAARRRSFTLLAQALALDPRLDERPIAR